MTETEFLVRADNILDQIEDQAEGWFEHLDIDVDANREGQVLTLVFNAKSHVVVNAQTPLQEMWLAAPTGAFHYRLEGETWVDTRGGPNLAEQISFRCTEIVGRDLVVTIKA